MPPMAAGDGIGGSAVPKSKFSGILMAGFASFGGILYGYDTGVINGVKVMPKFLEIFGNTRDANGLNALTSGRESLIVSILSAGTFCGALIGGPTSDILGRRWGVAFGCIWFCLGVGLQLGTTVGMFIAGRVFAGIGVGIISVLVPMYQSECSPKWIRGAVVGAYQWAITIGILLAACVNEGTKDNNNLSAYRIPIGIQFAWAAILVGGMLCLPESPRWLVKKGRDADAARALGRLVALPAEDPAVVHELELIRANLDAELALGESSYLDCFKGGPTKIRLRTLTGIFIQAWQQLTGINFIFYYGTTFFTNSGIRNPFTISIITNVVNVVCTLPGMWGVERFGRRRLLLVGAAGMLVCEFLVAIIGVSVGTQNQAGQKALIAFVCIYIAFFASTWGPIAWVITGEIFPLAVRAKAMSMSVASNWLWNFGIGYATPYLVNGGPGNANLGVKVFFIWGGTCTGCLVFTYFCVPETKGLSLEEIDELYRHTTPLKSVEYRRRLLTEGREFSDPMNKPSDIRNEKTKNYDNA